MLRVTKQQIEKFASPNEQKFIANIIASLRSSFPDDIQMNDGDFSSSIRIQITKANQYGLFIERNIAIYVVTAFLMGEDFDSNFEAVKHFLPNVNLDENTKASALEQWTKLVFNSLSNTI